MKILRVNGKNLASIAGEFDIDFTTEPLRSAGIFAICGPTGSGKSTLLDAICLALYNNTPRTTGIETARINDVGAEFIQQGDRRQILRRGTTEAIAAVEFAAIDGKIYRAVWRVWRANNKVNGKLQPVEWRVYDQATRSPITTGILEAENKLTQLTGLTYNQFTRTILLAQNEFARFLKARKEEKAEVLEKLTGTEIYAVVSNTVYTRTAAIRSVWKELNERIGYLHLLDEEEIAELNKQLENIGSQEKLLQQKQEDIQYKTNWYEQSDTLQKSIHKASGQLEIARKVQEEARAGAQWLQQIESVGSGRSCWLHKQERLAAMQSEQDTRKRLNEQLTHLQQAATLASRQTDQYRRQLEDYKKRYLSLKPVLLQARRLDADITHVGETLAEAGRTLEKISRTYELQQQDQKERQEHIRQLETRITAYKQWFEKNSRHRQMCLNINMINDFLESAHTAFLRIDELQKKLEIQKKQRSEYDKLLSLENEKLGKAVAMHKSLLQQRDRLEKQLNAIPVQELRKQRETLHQEKERFQQALTHLEKLFLLRESLLKQQEKLTDTEKTFATVRQRLQPITGELEVAAVRRDTARRSLENARMAASADITQLRSQLTTGIPCPVCGSPEHPYTRENQALDSVLSAIRQETEQYEQAYQQLQNEFVRLKTDRQHLEEALDNLRQDISLCRRNYEESNRQWEELSSAMGISGPIAPEDLNKRIATLTLSLAHIVEKESSWEKTHADYRALENQAAHLAQEIEKLNHSIQEVQKESATTEAELVRNTTTYEALRQQQEVSIEKISGMLSMPDWQERLRKDYPLFRTELNQAAEKWQRKSDQLLATEKEYGEVTAAQNEHEKNLVLLAQNKAEATHTRQKLTEQWETLKQKRSGLLEGKSADETEEAVQNEIDSLQRLLEKATDQQTRISGELEQIKGKYTQLQSTSAKTETDLQQANQTLQAWLEAYNREHSSSLTEEELGQLLQVGPADVQAERERQNLLREVVIQAQTTLNERLGQLERHNRLPGRPNPLSESLPTLQTLQAEITRQKENLQQQKTEISAQLHTHSENRKKAAGLQQELARQTDLLAQWSKLDELIGSQSGNKFKEIAQGYTLDILLSYANIQLQELTPRYRLQRVPDELALQIIDHDLCDEVRSVFSLSGGESFVISLALALGLSSFSARNHFEENLFIDEGFGTLDGDTLQIVMEALERLRSQGRQIGIISHVPELAERIPTRIRLVKTGNGKSKVKIESTSF